jgi:hypothetical protein
LKDVALSRHDGDCEKKSIGVWVVYFEVEGREILKHWKIGRCKRLACIWDFLFCIIGSFLAGYSSLLGVSVHINVKDITMATSS